MRIQLKQATPYLMFDRQAKEALAFYEDVFRAEITDLQTYGEANDLVLHAKIKKGNLLLMVSDTFPGNPLEAENPAFI
ncbi:hypothetical protein ABE28_020695 [Peribacillus muralis]|uniref:Uncharacterized protein n=2 Tax=Peribacillus muralis TaxID=264697 RepID=A0A1B3XUA7_9BACI|nr:hypothetical protein ABE28_020695 [Peribacillus muralis]